MIQSVGIHQALALGLTLSLPVVGATPKTGEGEITPGRRVVLNEIMYHPPDDQEELQFIEIHNPGATPADLSGWSLKSGVKALIPKQTLLPAGGFLVICKNIPAFRSRYGTNILVAGIFSGKLSHKGEKVVLADSSGQPVDQVTYSDAPPWPLGADGYGSSLERICPAQTSESPANWVSSALFPGRTLGGTPGQTNTGYSSHPLPVLSKIQFGPGQPGTPIRVTAELTDEKGVESVSLIWGSSAGELAEIKAEASMTRQSGDGRQGVYQGVIPPQPEGRLIRFFLQAKNASGALRLFPAKSEPRPAFSCSTFVNTNRAQVPFLKTLTFGALGAPAASRGTRNMRSMGLNPNLGQKRFWGGAVIYMPPGAREALLFDFVHIRNRKGGYKVHFHSDQPLDEMTGINLVFESPRWALAEALSYELFRRAGVMTPKSGHVRLYMDDQPRGYYLMVEQPNKALLRRHGRDTDGNLYKLLWYGQGLRGQHEKKNNPQTGHQDLEQMVAALNRTQGQVQWELIQQHFKVEEMASYFAVNMCIQNWDGFWNNYFAYHDLEPGGKWELIPWDEDKTWGDYDGASPAYDWYDMPLTFGSNLARPSRGGIFSFFQNQGPFGGNTSWWRPPGHFSGPLLANPEFRRRFLQRLDEVCRTLFTPEVMGPVIDQMEQRLAEEARFAAQHARHHPGASVGAFRGHMESFRQQLIHRRKFILDQLRSER